MLPSGLHRYQACMCYTDIHVGKTSDITICFTHAHVILIATLLLKVRVFLGALLFLMNSNAACGSLSWNFSVLRSLQTKGTPKTTEGDTGRLISVPAANDNFQDSFPVTNKAVINIHIQTFEWADIFISLEWIPGDVIAGSYVRVYVWLYWSRQTDSGAGAPFYISTATPRVPVSLHSAQTDAGISRVVAPHKTFPSPQNPCEQVDFRFQYNCPERQIILDSWVDPKQSPGSVNMKRERDDSERRTMDS